MIGHAACKTSHRMMIALVMAGASLAGCGRSPAPSDTASPPAPSRMIENAPSIVSSPSPTPPEPVSTALSLESLAGAWQVTAVHVGTEGVQALSENDPVDMGAVRVSQPVSDGAGGNAKAVPLTPVTPARVASKALRH